MYKLRLLYIPCVVRVQFRRVSGKRHIYLHSPLSEASLNCSHLFFRSLLLFMWNVEEMPCPSWEKESQRAQSSACFTCPTRWWPGARARWGPRALPALCTAASRGLRAAWRAVPRGKRLSRPLSRQTAFYQGVSWRLYITQIWIWFEIYSDWSLHCTLHFLLNRGKIAVPRDNCDVSLLKKPRFLFASV